MYQAYIGKSYVYTDFDVGYIKKIIRLNKKTVMTILDLVWFVERNKNKNWGHLDIYTHL